MVFERAQLVVTTDHGAEMLCLSAFTLTYYHAVLVAITTRRKGIYEVLAVAVHHG